MNRGQRLPILLLIILSLLVAPGASSKAERRAWKILEKTAQSDDAKELLRRAREFVEEYPGSDDIAQAHKLAGNAAFELGSWDLARTHLEAYMSLGGRSGLDRVRYRVAVAVIKGGDVAGGTAQLANVVANAENKEVAADAGRELVAQHLFDGRWRDALKVHGTMLSRGLFDTDEDLDGAESAIDAARRDVKAKGRTWSTDSWSRLEKSFEDPMVKGLIAALALDAAGDRTDSLESESARRAWAARFPEHPLVAWIPGASEYASEEEDSDPGVIGLLIPESGKYAAPGSLVRRGVEMALTKAQELGYPEVDLRIVDTTGDPAAAEAGIRRLVSEDRAIAVLGPMISAEAESLAPLTTELAIPTVMLTQRPGFETEDPYAFNAWMHPQTQVRALVDHAIRRMGLTSFAIAYPSKESAGDLARRFWEEVEDAGGTVVAVESYPAQETDFRETGRRLKGTYWEGKSPGEGDLQLPYMDRSKPHLAVDGAKELEPGIDFQAVFVPDSYNRVSMLAPGFLFEEINLGGHIEKVPSVVLLGGSALNHPGLVERGGKYIEGTVMVDGFFLGGDRAAVSEFAGAYRAAYESDPTLLEASAYDATLFLCQLLSEGVTSRRSLLQRLSLATPMVTVTGARGFEPGGAMQHEMLTLQVRKGKIVQVWPTSGDATQEGD